MVTEICALESCLDITCIVLYGTSNMWEEVSTHAAHKSSVDFLSC